MSVSCPPPPPAPRGLVFTAPCTESAHPDSGQETGLATEHARKWWYGPSPGLSGVFLALSILLCRVLVGWGGALSPPPGPTRGPSVEGRPSCSCKHPLPLPSMTRGAGSSSGLPHSLTPPSCPRCSWRATWSPCPASSEEGRASHRRIGAGGEELCLPPWPPTPSPLPLSHPPGSGHISSLPFQGGFAKPLGKHPVGRLFLPQHL